MLGAMYLRQIAVDGLGHLSTLVADEGSGQAAVIDPRRDVDVYLDEASSRDLRITDVFETHLHNDFVSGARELATLTGARHVIGAGAELRYGFDPVRDGDVRDVGALRFRVLETPGHTPEHVAYTVADRTRADDPLLMFTGGSLLVGAVGRTDLLGAADAVPYARRMFESLHERILPHDDHVAVYPTHGGGSLCSASISSTPWSTLGFERRHNELLSVEDIDEFARRLLRDQPAYPRYFDRMRGINQAGPAPLGQLADPRPLDVEHVGALLTGDHVLVDLRSPAEHAAGHVPGSISIPLGSSFGTWLGWVVPPDRPLVFLLPSPRDWEGALRQALRIGYEQVAGYLQGGFDAWQGRGLPVEASGRVTVRELSDVLAVRSARNGDAPLVLDVRQRDEYAAGHVPGAVHLMAGDLPDRLAELPAERPIFAICASGYRSSIAASLLQQAGYRDVSWVSGGVGSWRAAGLPVERS